MHPPLCLVSPLLVETGALLFDTGHVEVRGMLSRGL